MECPIGSPSPICTGGRTGEIHLSALAEAQTIRSDQTSGLENNHDVLVVDEFGIDDFLAFEFENGFFV